MPQRKLRDARVRATKSAANTGASTAGSPAGGAANAAAALTGSIRSLAGQVLDLAGAAMDASFGVGGLLTGDPQRRKDFLRAGHLLRKVRERAGLTLGEVGKAVDLKDAELLALAERGKVALPFEMILRLAAVLARNDPVPFVMSLTNSYSPNLGRMLETLGIGRLVEHARREHDFVTIYRARDAARKLSDEEFRRVLKFVEAAFDLALEFRAPGPAPKRGAQGRPAAKRKP